MKFLIIILLNIFNYKALCYPLNEFPKKAIIEINIENGYPLDSISLIYRNNFWPTVGGIQKINAQVISKGKYQINFNNDEPISYFSLIYNTTRGKQFLLHQNLIQPGDHIFINFKKNSQVVFEGKGSLKLQCAMDIQNAIKKWEKKRADSIVAFEKANNIRQPIQDFLYYKNQISNSNQRLYVCKEIALSVINQYKEKIPLGFINLIKANVLGDLELDNFQVLDFYYSNIDKTNEGKSLAGKEEFKALYYKRNVIDFSVFPEKTLLLSAGYQNFIIRSATKSQLLGEDGYSFLKRKYKGEIRDRLLTGFLLFTFTSNSNNAENVKDVLTVVKTPYCRAILEELYRASANGKEAFQFALADSTGKIVRQKDFLGKVVLLDFYFTGCTGCRGLNEKMINVFNRFKDNKNIAFISVSIDKDFLSWKSGINKHLYSHKGSIDLNTNGLGDKSPIIQHYKISAYPTLILIDKKGKIITVNPPRPYDTANEKKLFDMLTGAVNKEI